jgi:uncharacterized damage-inducible protein DinB
MVSALVPDTRSVSMKRLPLSILLLISLPMGTALAQEPMGGDNAATRSVAPLYETVKGYIIAAAEQMPEGNYGYRPTEEVRSFGEIVGHVANAMYFFCGTVNGTSTQGPENYEERTDKAGLVAGLKTSFQNCDSAYGIDDATAMQEVDFFGQTGTKLWVLTFNVAHEWEHYGNLVTYMRENGMVPPSSQGGGM